MINTYNARLIEKKKLARDVFWFKFVLKKPEVLNFKAGQYLIFKTPTKQIRLYSISSADYIKDGFELTIQIIEGGVASTCFANFKKEEIVSFQGPAGFFSLKTDARPKIILATGTGIAPIRSMILSLLKSKSETRNPKQIPNPNDQNSKRFENLDFKNLKLFRNSDLGFRIFLFWGLKTKDDVYFFEEFKKLSAENQNFNFKICLSREKNLERLDDKYFILGHVNDGLVAFFEQQRDTRQFNNETIKQLEIKNQFEYYVCGSRQTVSSIVDFLKEQGISKENIFFEKF